MPERHVALRGSRVQVLSCNFCIVRADNNDIEPFHGRIAAGHASHLLMPYLMYTLIPSSPSMFALLQAMQYLISSLVAIPHFIPSSRDQRTSFKPPLDLISYPSRRHFTLTPIATGSIPSSFRHWCCNILIIPSLTSIPSPHLSPFSFLIPFFFPLPLIYPFSFLIHFIYPLHMLPCYALIYRLPLSPSIPSTPSSIAFHCFHAPTPFIASRITLSCPNGLSCWPLSTSGPLG